MIEDLGTYTDQLNQCKDYMIYFKKYKLGQLSLEDVFLAAPSEVNRTNAHAPKSVFQCLPKRIVAVDDSVVVYTAGITNNYSNLVTKLFITKRNWFLGSVVRAC